MSFSINELIYRVNLNTFDTLDNRRNRSYSEVLTRIQHLISNNHGAELAEVLYSDVAERTLKALIVKYLNSERMTVEGVSNIAELTDKLYGDMAGIGIITEYLKDPDVEEININAYNGVWVQYKDRKERLNYTFSSPQDCVNILKKMSRFGNVILDGSKPIGDSYISKGVRMSGAIAPCVDDDIGGIGSVRVQKSSIITRDNLIKWETATDEQLDFLCLCVNNGISLAFSGATGSGKTADAGFVLSQVEDNRRIVTIEDTFELKLAKYDENGLMQNEVVNLLTKEAPNPITMSELLKFSLRLHPQVLVPAEMRGEEAITVQEAGRTGHTIVSTLHANSALSAYDRILTMCLQGGTTLSEERLLKNIVEAFPIMVFKMQLPDNSRKYMEIFEATGVENGSVVGTTLYKFHVVRHERDASGKIVKTHGAHTRTGHISKTLAERLHIMGVDENVIKRYAGDNFNGRE